MGACDSQSSQKNLLKSEKQKKSSSPTIKNIQNNFDSYTNAVGPQSSKMNLIQREENKDSFVKSIKERIRESVKSEDLSSIIGDDPNSIDINLNRVIEEFYEMKSTLRGLESLLQQLTLLPKFRSKQFDKIITKYEESNQTFVHIFTPYMRQIHAIAYKGHTEQIYSKLTVQNVQNATQIQKLKKQVARLIQQKIQLNQSLKEVKEYCEQQLQIQNQILKGEKKRKKQLYQEIEQLKHSNKQLTKRKQFLQNKLNTINLSLKNLSPLEPKRNHKIPKNGYDVQ